MAKLSVEDAKKVVHRLTKKYGYLNQEMMEEIGNWNPEYRREIDENWLAIESTAAHSVKTLAKQIYGSGARFVFELLQNADDNVFNEAAKASSDPFISFKVHPKHIIVECNEDGFSARDLDAISAVGQSTKSSSNGYIGAKGIGFKSVFIAAWRVYIQSGNFSFEFKHRKSDPGLGMVRPIWVDSDEQLAGPLTRMTLTLHDEGDKDDLEHLRSIIHKQFADLQQTCLLFLRKLRRISIEFYREDGTLERSKTFQKKRVDDYRVSVETRHFKNDEETTESQMYHITSRTATNLTRSDNRDAPETDTLRTLLSTAAIVLAFPLTPDFEPMITGKQELFAFLPIRESDYKFLIHTDFDTSANRQDVVTTSRRNRDLLSEIAETLIKAILEFCEHSSLRYTWPLFLPKTDDTIGMFWSDMNTTISTRLKQTPCMISRNRTALRLIGDVLTMFGNFKDENGDPLFDDDKDRFVSSLYTEETMKILKGYGLYEIPEHIVLDMVEADLRDAYSRMKGYKVSKEWHSRVAKMLTGIHKRGWLHGRVEKLEMIPLQDGGWTSANAQQVYYPTTQGIDIPGNLKLSTLSAHVMGSANRKQLFDAVGVKQASVELVRNSIFKEFGGGASKTITIWRDYVHYLYLTHTTETRQLYANTPIADRQKVKLNRPQELDIYLPNCDGSFSPESLLAPTDTAPGMEFRSTHSLYVDNAPARPSSEHPTWERWLCDLIGVRERLRLLSRDGKELSEAAHYVFKHHKDKFLGFFEHLWSVEHPRLDNKLKAEIKKLPAKELCGVNFSVTLDRTWLPVRQLRDLVAKFMTKAEVFPFLKIEESDKDMQLGLKWNFLHDNFSVGRDSDVSFLIDILHYIEEAKVDGSSISQIQKVYDLYTAMYAQLIRDDSGGERVDKYFQSKGIIVPDEDIVSWVCSDDCRWIAPPDMKTTISLKSIYARTLGTEQLGNIRSLLQDTSHVRNASLPDVIEELEYMRTNGCHDGDHVGKLYDYVISLDLPVIQLKAAFEDNALIYAVEDGDAKWFRTSECLWSSPTRIRGKAILEEHYENLGGFFVETLGVRSLTLQMIYDDLQQEGRTDIDKLRNDLLTLSSFLQEEPEAARKLKTGPILRANVFPVRYANASPELRTAQVDFAIGDRQYLTNHFKDQICLLDFKLKDIRPLGALIKWAGLEDRYLSRRVHEETFVSEGTERRIRSYDRDVGRKAYQILRVAADFGSPRYEADRDELYAKLRTSEVIMARRITSVAKMIQSRQLYSSQEVDGTFHMSDTEEGLKLYVPRSRRKQDTCFTTSLPKRLAEWLMQDPKTLQQSKVPHKAESTLSLILSCGRSALDEVLDHQGVPEIDLENQDPDTEAEDSELDDDASVSDAAWDSRPASAPQFTPAASIISDNPPTVVERVARETTYSSSNSLRDPVQTVDEQYINLLDRVIRLGRNSGFPSRGAFDMSGLQDVLSNVVRADAYDNYDGHGITFRFRSASQLDRDKKVGAAGELYVFELLSGLGLPSWSRRNWQSTIRTLVNAHHEYADIGAWNALETADIVYDDTTGMLTRLLVEQGYLDHNDWHGQAPKYFVEVKTTTGPCNVPFFVSEKQYRLMRSVHANHNEDRSIIYLICRVFNVNSDNIGMRVYLDPEKLRQDGQLRFTAQAWSVTPGNGIAPE